MAMEGDSDCIHGINLDYSHCLICEGLIMAHSNYTNYDDAANSIIESLISDQSFDGYCPTCGQCYQGHLNKYWQRFCILMMVAGFIFGGVLGFYIHLIVDTLFV